MSRSYLSYHEFINWFRSLMEEQSAAAIRLENGVLHCGHLSCRIPIVFCDDDLCLESLDERVDRDSIDLIILLQSGRASLALICGEQILAEKHIRKYMNRMSQGRSQLSYLNQKGKSRLGSRIRLRQGEQFFAELNQVITGWQEEHEICKLFLSCSPKLKGFWYDSPDMPFVRRDPRWRRVPLDVHPPDRAELRRILRLMCRAELFENEI